MTTISETVLLNWRSFAQNCPLSWSQNGLALIFGKNIQPRHRETRMAFLPIPCRVPTQMVVWSIVGSAQYFIKGRTSFLITRALLGMLQGGFIPEIILYLRYLLSLLSSYNADNSLQVISTSIMNCPYVWVFSGPLQPWLTSWADF